MRNKEKKHNNVPYHFEAMKPIIVPPAEAEDSYQVLTSS